MVIYLTIAPWPYGYHCYGKFHEITYQKVTPNHMEELKNKAPDFGSSLHISDWQAIKNAALLLLLVVLAGILSQNIYGWISHKYLAHWLGLLAGVVVFVGALAMFGKSLFKIVDTPPFNVTNLIAIAFATALGTFIPQQSDNLNLSFTDKLVGFLHLDDLFHSWWYVSFFILLAVGLVKASARKKIDVQHVGFHLAHLSPILILFGFWVDYFLGFRGIIKLEEGQQANTVQIYKGNTGFYSDSTVLDFSIRLDEFDFEKYQPDYRIQLWKRDTLGHAVEASHGGSNDPKPPKIVASLPLEKGKIHRIYGTDMYFRMAEFYPDFEFDYEYPTQTDTIAANDPGILIDLKTSEGDAFVQLRTNKPGKNKLGDVVNLGASLEFFWELPNELKNEIESKKVNAELAKENRIIFEGKNKKIYFVTNGLISVEPLKTKSFYATKEGDSIGFSVRFLMPAVGYLKSLPSSKSEELKRPVAKIEAWKSGGPAQISFIYPSSLQDKTAMYMVPGTVHFIALESLKDKETKYFKSELSVVNKAGEIVKKQSLKVNEPMLYDGYRFYQSDYDPAKPTYSGIGVSHEPGLMVIYLGFFLLVAGVAHMFYLRRTLES
ncbi:MAG: cytochrome c biogenesis protein ResB [Saprospiraceae bacterium]|nr:cytochrome c biogenesis protein ResB [Saprospiraceae bacterium]MCF8251963.1 cytochrome c biogenesis protein ResB [Saprospiraceae bacterium]MCF8282772.1 cytochrome c biogenesis protein ResB [Bacteroidales bacterium]MCF8313633.1 cytochrome c biogenesis protein ResB [Saprospiraceae bacterium]MCF8442340.1 cytochrome c biogenesis protein ResB [Saprospiraceae bacterium]